MRVLLLARGFLLLLIIGSTFLTCGIFDNDESEEPAPFSMQVIPTKVAEAIPGQKCVFLVSVADEGSGSGKGKEVTISVTAPVSVKPQTITPGQVAEVTLIPDEESIGETLEATIFGERNGLEQTETVKVNVLKFQFPGEQLTQLAQTAAEMRDKFILWLAVNHFELDITSETEWTGTIIRPHQFIVRFHLFFSADWEMGLTWHTTRPPDNWTRIYLRRRFTETHPSRAFEISSWSAEGEEPHAIDPQDPLYFMSEVWR